MARGENTQLEMETVVGSAIYDNYLRVTKGSNDLSVKQTNFICGLIGRK